MPPTVSPFTCWKSTLVQPTQGPQIPSSSQVSATLPTAQLCQGVLCSQETYPEEKAMSSLPRKWEGGRQEYTCQGSPWPTFSYRGSSVPHCLVGTYFVPGTMAEVGGTKIK